MVISQFSGATQSASSVTIKSPVASSTPDAMACFLKDEFFSSETKFSNFLIFPPIAIGVSVCVKISFAISNVLSSE